MYRTIVVPLDGSSFSEHALAVAAQLAAGARATLALVRVHQRPAHDLHDQSSWDELFHDEEEAYLERTAAALRSRHGVDVETDVITGPIVHGLCRYVEGRESALVVMSTHGRTGVSRAWLGSVADGVMHHCTRPLLMVRPAGARTTSRSATAWRRMLVPLDGSTFAEQVLPHAMQVAALLPASVTLLRVVEPVSVPIAAFAGAHDTSTDVPRETIDVVVQSAAAYLTSVGARLQREYPTIDVGTDVRIAGSPARAVIERAQTGDCGVVALATHGRGVSRLFLGSVADKVIRGAGDAILLVRPNRD